MAFVRLMGPLMTSDLGSLRNVFYTTYIRIYFEATVGVRVAERRKEECTRKILMDGR